ncbi:MAG: DUF91 domain-containing protein [Halodesulfurarchaeum sp.]
MQDPIQVIAGQCTVRHEGEETTESEGRVVVLVKPDGTVLVHDATGYQPARWLTRAESVQLSVSEGDFELRAQRDGADLRVSGTGVDVAAFPATAAGPRVGTCPDCGAGLVRAAGAVTCLGCGAAFALPRDATITDATCADCGLPTISVRRGADLTVCLDRRCDPIDEAVRDRFDGEWECPTCGTALRITRNRTLEASCATCEAQYPIPYGTASGACACGLPWFETDRGGRCLDPDCAESRSVSPPP